MLRLHRITRGRWRIVERMGRTPAWDSFDEARELFYAANSAHRASSRPLNAVPLLRRSMLLLLRAVALNERVTSLDRDDILAAAVQVEERERVLRIPIAQDLELLDQLEQRFAELDGVASSEQAARLERLIEDMPRILTSVRRHLLQSRLTPAERGRRRRRVRWAATLFGVVALVLIPIGAVNVALPLYRAAASDGINGAYFADASLQKFSFERRDSSIDFDWRDGAPDPDLPVDGFSVRWRGELRIAEPGRYTFYLNSDDGSRLYVQDELVVDNWSPHGELERQGFVDLRTGNVPIRVEYFDHTGTALVQLAWSTPSRGKHVIPPARFVH